MASIFGGLSDAKVTAGGVYFDCPRDAAGKVTGNGLYRVLIKGCKTIVSSRSRATMFVVECEIEASNVRHRPKGMNCSQVIDMTQIMGLPNAKAFIAAASGADPTATDVNEVITAAWKEVTGRVLSLEDIAELVVSEKQPLADLSLKLETVEIITVGKKQPFTKHLWSPLPDENWSPVGV